MRLVAVLRWIEVISAGLVPARIARAYLRWRVRTSVPGLRHCTMLEILAAAERRLGDLTSSEMSARKAIELFPEESWPYVELAATLEAAGRRSEAREALQTVTQMPELTEVFRAHIVSEIERLGSAPSQR